MKTIKTTRFTEFKADRLTIIPPVIRREFRDQDGTRMYETADDKHYIADIYDAKFRPARTAIKKDIKYSRFR